MKNIIAELRMKIKGIGDVVVYGTGFLLPESELVFCDRKTGKFSIRKWKELSLQQQKALFGEGRNKLKSTFIGKKVKKLTKKQL